MNCTPRNLTPGRPASCLLLLLTLWLAAAPPLLCQDTPQALLVFYRPKHFYGYGNTPSVYLDGHQIARLDNGRYFSIRVEPGIYSIESNAKRSPLRVQLKKGAAAYLEMSIVQRTWSAAGVFVVAEQDYALPIIRKLKPLDKKWIFDERVDFDIETESQPAATAETQPTDAVESPNPAICVVRVNSEPEAADIELDGRFVGNTPTVLRLEPGDYTITVKKTGYDAWERTLTALAGNELRLFAELKKQE